MSRSALVSEPPSGMPVVGARPSGGVVLLVMLGLLSIFTLISVTFVVSSGHARRGAGAASRAEQMGDPFEVLLNQAMMQVARGSNHPQSAIGPHGLLEDVYGNSGVVAGAVYFEGGSPGTSIYGNAPLSSQRSQPNAFGSDANEKYQAPMLIEIGAVSFGWDREPGTALIDDNSNMVIDDVAEAGLLTGDDCFLGMTRAHPATVGIPAADWQGAWKNGATQIIDNVENYYAGRVITFVNGDCAGQSSYIVRSKIANDEEKPSEFRTILFINPFPNGSQPRHSDRFVINGRAFSGPGFGYSPYNAQTGAAKSANNTLDLPNLRALDFPYSPLLIQMPGYGFDALANSTDPDPIATLPNPTDSGVRDYINRYSPIVSMNEDYDAADEQNMLLSYTAATGGGYRTIMPSLHRPDLVRYHTAEHAGANARWVDVPPYIRRRYILRPDPSDHYDYTQEATGGGGPNDGDGWTPGEPYDDANQNQQWDPGEQYTDTANPTPNGVYDVGDRSFFNPSFDAMNGPWDLDNDGDGQPDTIWVDLGMPVTTTSDGKFVKPMFGILVRDLDGRINLNAHGSPKHYTHIHNGVYMAEDSYNLTTKPPDNRYNTEERVRMGIYDVAMMQLISAPGGPMVSSSTGAGSNVVKTHSVGHMDVGSFHGMATQDVRFEANKLFALSYNADKPGNNNLIPYAAYMFDLSGFRAFDGNADYDRMVDGFEPAVGQGYSAADINIAQVLHNGTSGLPSLPSATQATGAAFPRGNPIRRIFEGEADASGELPPREGRYGEGHLIRPSGKVFTGTGAPSAYGYFPGLGVVPRGGVTDMVKARRDSYSRNSPLYNATTAVVPDMSGAMVPATSFYSSARPPYDGDDDSPRLPVKDAYGQNPTGNSKFQFGSGARNLFMQSPSDAVGLRNGDYGTPGDFDSDGFVALDIMGNPVYERMGTAFEDVDAPTEINLNRRYNAQTYFGASANSRTDANRPKTAAIDAPYTPAELERVLRNFDGSAGTLPSRLNSFLNDDKVSGDAERSITTEQWDIPCPHIAPTPELSAALNTLGLPLVNPSIGDMLRARFFLASGATTTNLALTVDQSAALAIMAMRSYRLSSSEAAPVSGQLSPPARKRGHTRLLSPDLGMGLRMDLNAPFGNGFDDDGNTVVDEPREPPGADARFDPLQGPLPGSLINFDGNRDGNFHPDIDEEARQQYAKELYCLMMLLVDQNYVEPLPTSVNIAGDGVGVESEVDGAGILVNFPTMSNEGQAAKTFTYIGQTLDPNLTPEVRKNKIAVMKTQRFLFARKIAQWAVNAVDFRDRDAIMTPFEFDADPFYDNDGDTGTNTNAGGAPTPGGSRVMRPTGNGTWDVDGYIIKKTPTGAPDTAGDPDIRNPWRGLVWGCEYPDLILTETLAFHDRRAQNLYGTTTTSGTGASGLLFSTTNSLTPSNSAVTPTHDLTWDQRRVPQGSAFIELFATGNRHNPALPRELYTLHTYQDQVITVTVPPGVTQVPKTHTELRLDLGRIAGDPNGTGPSTAVTPYPVWRLVITESHTRSVTNAITDTRMSIAERIQEWPATCSLELSDPGMSLLSPLTFSNVSSSLIPVEKVIHFSSSTSTQLNVGARAGLTQTAIEVYSNQYKGAVDSAYLSPGDYAVIGPYRAANSGPRNITMIGRTETRMVTETSSVTGTMTSTTITVVDYNQPPAIIDLGDWTSTPRRPFLVTSVNGQDEYPRTGIMTSTALMISATSGLVRAPSTGTASAGALDYPAITTANPQQQIRVPVAIPVACTSNPPSARLVGLNISEPNTAIIPSQYYPLPNAPRTDSWLPGLVTQDFYSPVRDVPLDDDNDGAAPVNPLNRNKSLPIEVVADQTVLNFKTVFLQRLANPLMPWNLYENPYLTVDWMPLDLTIFNGEPHYVPATAPHGYTVENFKEPRNEVRYVAPSGAPPPNPSIPPAAIRFGTRQRGAPRFPLRGQFSLFDLWSQPNWLDASPEFDTRPPPTGPVSKSALSIPNTLKAAASAASTYSAYYKVDPVRFQDPLQHTLGFINQGYHSTREQPGVDAKGRQLIPVQEPFRRTSTAAASLPRSGWYTMADVTKNNDKYVGAPRRPFNWLTWNNRPYAGSMELMLVPATSISRLMHDYTMRRPITPAVPDIPATTATYNSRLAPFDPRRNANHYLPMLPAAGRTNWADSGGTTTAGRLLPGYSATAPFAHLLNFFESSEAGMAQIADPVTKMLPTGAANYFRLFEFVTVPSRFSGTKRMHLQSGSPDGSVPEGRNNAALPLNGSPTAPYGTADEHFGWPFTAPFNYIPLYREPGRININTIIPLGGHDFAPSSLHSFSYARTHRGERVNDNGAGIWRSVINDFHPAMRWLAPVNGLNDSGGARVRSTIMSFGLRANDMSATNYTKDMYFFNPSEDTVDNFYSAFASMMHDNPKYDPRGPNGIYQGGGDDAFHVPFWTQAGNSRHDHNRPSLFSNPFRSFMANYSDVVNSSNPRRHKYRSGYPLEQPNPNIIGRPLLAADATLMRRRDTSWSPYDGQWLPTSADANNAVGGLEATLPMSKLFSPAQIDPRFDPMFTLNYPRPWQQQNGFSGPPWSRHSGYTSPLVDARPGAVTTYSDIGLGSVDTMRVRDTDFRNTDRNPFFRYQLYTKLSNAVTTRSNVYAIWITIGFFECEKVQPNANFKVQAGHDSDKEFSTKHRYPDGYRIVREVGSDTGETQRHRAFAILDRTIPVGFMRGENLNVDRAFIIRHILD